MDNAGWSRTWVGGVVACLLGAVAPARAADRVIGAPFATRSVVMAPEAMAATSIPLATTVALEVMRRGGSAVDAAIAANAVQGLMEPTGCGIGGDLFAIVWDPATSRLHGLNASGRAPATMTIDEIRRRGLARIPAHGVLPVTVPGCVDGWFELHARFGKLPMADVLAPAIRYAREGFPVQGTVAFYWEASARVLGAQPGFRETFTRDGRAPAAGERWTNPDLAATYEQLAAGGRDAFYRGPIAAAIADWMARHDGLLAAGDLAAHRSEWVEPVSTNYRGVDVWELPPPGQGIAALQILNLLEAYDLRSAGFGSPLHLHAFVEAKKLAFADRARYYADPAFVDVPTAWLLSKEYAAERRALINPERASRRVDPGTAILQENDTIYLTTADRDGMMVSLIQSNYRGMGSGVCPPGLGFGLHDRGEMFSLDPAHPNALAPGKRPFHTIIPGFLTRDGKPWISFGVMGGAMQPQGHAQVVMNLVDFGMDLQEAGDAPRVQHDGSSEPTGEEMTDGGRVQLESGFPAATIRELMRRGHKVAWDLGGYGRYQAILWDPVNRMYHGASDARADGHAAGY